MQIFLHNQKRTCKILQKELKFSVSTNRNSQYKIVCKVQLIQDMQPAADLC